MPTDPDIAELLTKQAALVEKAQKLGELKDGEQISREANKLAEEAKKLEAAAQEVAKKKEAEGAALREKLDAPPDREPRIIKVALTDEQRTRVLEDTGVRVEVVALEEGKDIPAPSERFMPDEHPAMIEAIARKKAEQQKSQKEADAAAREAVGQAMADIEAAAITRDQEQALKNLKKDPDFIGNLPKQE